MTNGTLYVVATPIGNRDDLAPRARQILAEVQIVASEDTRRTGRLLSHFGINASQIALHEHNELAASERLIAVLQEGGSVALVSDAGTPLISDPGYRLLALAHEGGIPVSPVPGPCALVAALSVAGLPTDRFSFEGFLPAKAAARRGALKALLHESRTMIFYEAVHRIRDTVKDMADIFGDTRTAFLGRELSKMHEQCVQTSFSQMVSMLADGRIVAKGEFVLVVGGTDKSAPSAGLDVDALLRRLAPLMPHRQAAEIAAEASGLRRNELYKRLLELGAGKTDEENN